MSKMYLNEEQEKELNFVDRLCLLFCKIPLKYRENYGIINICEIMIHALHG